MPSPPIVRKAGTLLRAGPTRQMLVAEAAASMLAARAILLLRPFAAVSRGFGTLVPPDDARAIERGSVIVPADALVARRVGWAIRASAPFMPFRSVCLQQAMAARAMLARRGIACVLHLGAGRGEARPIEAHAWVDAAGAQVTGYPLAPNLVEIGCFV